MILAAYKSAKILKEYQGLSTSGITKIIVRDHAAYFTMYALTSFILIIH